MVPADVDTQRITLITCCRELWCVSKEYLGAAKKSGDAEDLGSFTAHLHLCIFCVVSYKWSLLPNPLAISECSVLLGRQNCLRHSQGQSSCLLRIVPKECLEKSRAGRATLVLWSLGNRAFQHPCVRNRRQSLPRTRTQAQGKQDCGSCTDEEETFKSSCSPYRVPSQSPGDTYWAGVRHSCDGAELLWILCAPWEIPHPRLLCQGERHAKWYT